jgi:hypothetical protein
MKRGTVAVIAVLMLGPAAGRLQAQTTVQGAVIVQSGPGAGPIEVRQPVREVLVVERVRTPRGHAHGWWRKQGYRRVTVYYDGRRYFVRRVARPGIRAVMVYERAGRYYMADDAAKGEGHHRDGHHDDHDDD